MSAPTMAKRFNRKKRRVAPPESATRKPTAMQPPTPQANPKKTPRNMIWMILPAVLVVAVIGMIVFFVQMRGPAMSFVFPGLALFSMVGMAMYGLRGFGRNNQVSWGDREQNRREYLDDLDGVRDTNQEIAAAQFELNQWANTSPSRLIELVGSDRMWERRPGDKDFLDVRLGTGVVEVDQGALKWEDMQIPHSEELEQVTGNALRRFMLVQTKIEGMGKTVNLASQPGFGIVGNVETVTNLVWSMLLSLATYQSPTDVKIAIVSHRPEVWEWVKWLPHNRHDELVDACGPRRLVFEHPLELEEACGVTDLNFTLRDQWESFVSDSDSDDSPSSERSLLATDDGSARAGRRQHWIVVDDSTGTTAEWSGLMGDYGMKGVTFLRIAETRGSGIGFNTEAQVFEVRD